MSIEEKEKYIYAGMVCSGAAIVSCTIGIMLNTYLMFPVALIFAAGMVYCVHKTHG